MLSDSETKVSGSGEVLLVELKLLDLESTLKNLLSLGSSNGNVNGDFLISSNSERSNGVSGLGRDRGLSSKLLENLEYHNQHRERLTRLLRGSWRAEGMLWRCD